MPRLLVCRACTKPSAPPTPQPAVNHQHHHHHSPKSMFLFPLPYGYSKNGVGVGICKPSTSTSSTMLVYGMYKPNSMLVYGSCDFVSLTPCCAFGVVFTFQDLRSQLRDRIDEIANLKANLDTQKVKEISLLRRSALSKFSMPVLSIKNPSSNHWLWFYQGTAL